MDGGRGAGASDRGLKWDPYGWVREGWTGSPVSSVPREDALAGEAAMAGLRRRVGADLKGLAAEVLEAAQGSGALEMGELERSVVENMTLKPYKGTMTREVAEDMLPYSVRTYWTQLGMILKPGTAVVWDYMNPKMMMSVQERPDWLYREYGGKVTVDRVWVEEGLRDTSLRGKIGTVRIRVTASEPSARKLSLLLSHYERSDGGSSAVLEDRYWSPLFAAQYTSMEDAFRDLDSVVDKLCAWVPGLVDIDEEGE